MATEPDRARLRRAEERLQEWIVVARDRAFEELFQGPDRVLSEAELQRLDRIDSELSRRRGRGLWGEDEYGIITTGLADEESAPRVVCTYHPEIPFEGVRGESSIDEATREEFNDVLWEYCERVADHVQADLERFLAKPTEE